MFTQWFIFNHRSGMKSPDRRVKVFYISLAVVGITEFIMAMVDSGFEQNWSLGHYDHIFGLDIRDGILYMLLIMCFYLILLRGFRFITQKTDPEGLDTMFLITKMMQLSIIKNILYLLYYLIILIADQIETISDPNGIELETIYMVLHVTTYIISVLYLIPLIMKRIEANYSDYNKLLTASTFLSILVFSILFTLNYTVVRILIELPLGI